MYIIREAILQILCVLLLLLAFMSPHLPQHEFYIFNEDIHFVHTVLMSLRENDRLNFGSIYYHQPPV